METIKIESENKNLQLKHLGFVRVFAIQTLVFVSNLYDYAKKNSGPLRSTVGTVEGAVTTVVGPVYEKIKDVPDDLLVFLDKKVDKATDKFDKHASPSTKQAINLVQNFINRAAKKAENFVNEAQRGGPRAALHYATTEYKQFLLNLTVNGWNGLNQWTPFHKVADRAAPTVANCSEKYNHLVKELTGKGYSVFGYLPLVPVDAILKSFEKGEAGATSKPASDEHKSGSHSDSD